MRSLQARSTIGHPNKGVRNFKNIDKDMSSRRITISGIDKSDREDQYVCLFRIHIYECVKISSKFVYDHNRHDIKFDHNLDGPELNEYVYQIDHSDPSTNTLKTTSVNLNPFPQRSRNRKTTSSISWKHTYVSRATWDSDFASSTRYHDKGLSTCPLDSIRSSVFPVWSYWIKG